MLDIQDIRISPKHLFQPPVRSTAAKPASACFDESVSQIPNSRVLVVGLGIQRRRPYGNIYLRIQVIYPAWSQWLSRSQEHHDIQPSKDSIQLPKSHSVPSDSMRHSKPIQSNPIQNCPFEHPLPPSPSKIPRSRNPFTESSINQVESLPPDETSTFMSGNYLSTHVSAVFISPPSSSPSHRGRKSTTHMPLSSLYS